MALTVQVSKVSVTEPQAGSVSVTLNLTILDEAVEVFSQNFTQTKHDAVTMQTMQERFRVQMQEAIDRYKREQVMFTKVQLDDAVAALQASLVG